MGLEIEDTNKYHLIDVVFYGNVVKLFFGGSNYKDAWGDDWDDRPYEHNAGEVYAEYVVTTKELAFDSTHYICEPCEGSLNSPWSKEDMKNHKVPMFVVLKLDEQDSRWMYEDFSKCVSHQNAIKFYFGDTWSEIVQKLPIPGPNLALLYEKLGMEIRREEFCKIFDDSFVELLGDILQDNHYIINTDSFTCFYDINFEEVYLINKESLFENNPKIINWYKLTHTGRALRLSGISTITELQDFKDSLQQELLDRRV